MTVSKEGGCTDTITADHARRIALCCQRLDGRWHPRPGPEGTAETIEGLGYVQIDTIAVVHRAHEHTLWCRQPDYDPRMLHQLLAHDRRVFEYWTHAASYVPMADYRYYVRRMRAVASGGRTRDWMKENRRTVADVRRRIREEGPLLAADFKEMEAGKRGPWWEGRKPSKIALECLFDTGELMIDERRNFQRVYDLAERVLPDSVDPTPPQPAEQARWAVRRALGNRGVATMVAWGPEGAGGCRGRPGRVRRSDRGLRPGGRERKLCPYRSARGHSPPIPAKTRPPHSFALRQSGHQAASSRAYLWLRIHYRVLHASGETALRVLLSSPPVGPALRRPAGRQSRAQGASACLEEADVRVENR